MIDDLTDVLEGIVGDIKSLIKRVSDQETQSHQHLVVLTAHLQSANWLSKALSTTSKTVIDLSAEFGVPAGVKAILVRIFARDAASYAGLTYYFGLSPNNTSGTLAVDVRPAGVVNDALVEGYGLCPCDANGDVYYQCVASGAGMLDATIIIWGYLI